jgi:hypothetical protein
MAFVQGVPRAGCDLNNPGSLNLVDTLCGIALHAEIIKTPPFENRFFKRFDKRYLPDGRGTTFVNEGIT